MLTEETINQRLKEMETDQDDLPDLCWPENCAGSRKALVIFVGPSPGGKKDSSRRSINISGNKPLWNKPYNDPLTWSPGFRVSFPAIVEELIGKPYPDAAKLIARFNMDWLQNPNAHDVSYRYMWEGCSYILPVLYDCKPELIIPMDEKTFGVLQIALYHDGYEIISPKIDEIKVKISDANGRVRYHKNIMAFKAEKAGISLLVIKSLQHPARIFDIQYAQRIGQTIRAVAEQIWNAKSVNV